MDLRPHDRRLSPRTTTESRIEWTVPRATSEGTVLVTEEAMAENVSISGVIIRAAAVDEVLVDDVVHIAVAGHEGAVRVRRIEPTGTPGEACYAGELIAPTPELTDALLGDSVAKARRELEAFRSHARAS